MVIAISQKKAKFSEGPGNILNKSIPSVITMQFRYNDFTVIAN